jgi:hypothetical protein
MCVKIATMQNLASGMGKIFQTTPFTLPELTAKPHYAAPSEASFATINPAPTKKQCVTNFVVL